MNEQTIWNIIQVVCFFTIWLELRCIHNEIKKV